MGPRSKVTIIRLSVARTGMICVHHTVTKIPSAYEMYITEENICKQFLTQLDRQMASNIGRLLLN